MQTVKILHCADIHIGASESFLGALATKRRFETLITFEKILETARDNQVKLLLIAGDLFDSNNIEDIFFDRVLEGIASADEIEIVYAAGNHDPFNLQSPFFQKELPKNFHILSTSDDCVALESLNVRVYGRSFAQAYSKGAVRFSLCPDDNYINIMCIHGELRSDLNSDYNSITKEFISESKMDYIALGHIHKRTDIGKIGNTYCAYCGCPEGQGFDETDEKGVYIGEVGKGVCHLDFIRIAKRLHLIETVDISECSDSAQAAETVLSILNEKHGAEYTENLYKIILSGELDENVQISTDEIYSRINDKIYFLKLCNDTEIKLDLETISREKSLKGIFVKKMCEKISSAVGDEKETLQLALKIGLKAFKSEVTFDED